ncbi:MAG TPA: AAA family ATPase, partial [Polyangiaceae bacterium]
MRLRRVEAVRFGQLENESLGDLGDGLTVVFGPNEAGKSTYTALVRHVLYGFPTPAAKEPRYLSAAGKRHGRLVFEDPDGRWVVERVEGPHGGAVTVSAVEGVERPSLLDEVRHGVSQDAFRIVFGFGLAEMAQIEELRGAEEGVVARLYAAGAGLAVPPQDVRAAIDKQAEELFAPRAAARVANKAHARMREIRSRLRTLEDEAARYASDQATLADLRSDLEQARARRDAAAVRNRELERSAGLVEEREREIESLDRQLLEARRSVAQMIVQRDAIAPDEGLIAAGPKVDAMLAELAAHRDRLQRLTAMESALADTERRLEAQSVPLGLSASNLPDLSP